MEAVDTYEINSASSFGQLHFDDVQGKKIVFPENMPITKGTLYGYTVWQLKDVLNERHATVNDSKTRIEWENYTLPPLITDDLKRFSVISLFSTLCANSSRKKCQKPNTVATRVKSLAKFFSRIYECSILLKRGNKEVSTITKLSDISYELMQRVALDYPELGNEVILGLKSLSKPEIRRFLNSKPEDYEWVSADVKNIKFKNIHRQKQPGEDWESKTLPNSLFKFVTKNAVSDVATAIVAFGGELIDKSISSAINHDVLAQLNNAQAVLDDYVEIRRLDVERCKSSSIGVRSNGSQITNYTGVERKAFKENHGLSVKQFLDWWTMCRVSAQILILQYIGFRHSESLSLKFDHAHPGKKTLISKSGNIWLITGTEVKRKDNTLPVNQDKWVAIPVVRDSIALLERFNIILNKSYVFSSSQVRGRSNDSGKSYDREKSDKPFSPSGFSEAINQWKKKKDINGEWAQWKFNVKQFRHSIANQLARAELGLEFITYQMKHMVHAFSDTPSDVTLGYGGITEMMQENALKTAKEEAVRNLFHPDSPVSGGMAEEFKASRLAHFKGAMANGVTEGEYFSMLAEQGVPFINVGGGYCSGRKYVQYSDGSKSQPACVGSYECSPKKCANAIVTKAHVPVWTDMYKNNVRNAKNPELFYAKDVFLEKANDARDVLIELNVNVDEL